MKILIMGFTKIKYMPYMNFYIENLDRSKVEIHILYWNRDLQDEDLSGFQDCLLHEFRFYQEDDVSKVLKIKSFLKYRRNAKQILKRGRFDFIFVLHSLSGVMVADVLKKHYSGKYIFDYRDSTYEGFATFKKVVASITKNSYATFVSSDAFRRFLPWQCKDKIFTSHNLLIDSLTHRDEKKIHEIKSDKIRIAFWGFIRDEKINKKIIERLCNDDRFELHYYGREQQTAFNLKKYAELKNAKNIYFHGEYVPEQRYDFARQTDVIHNIFDDANMMLAMGNKYYDGAIFRIPQICMPDSFMGKCVERAGIGFVANPEIENFADNIYNSYKKIVTTDFDSKCDAELARVLEEYNKGIRIIKEIFK